MSHGSEKLIYCECCQLQAPTDGRHGSLPPTCDACYDHRGPEKALTRAQAHEAELRRRLEACRSSEEHAQQAKEIMQERMVSALQSRGALAARIVDDPDNAYQLASDERVMTFAERHRNPHGYVDPGPNDDDPRWSLYPAKLAEPR